MLDVLLFAGVMVMLASAIGAVCLFIPFAQIPSDARKLWRKRLFIAAPAAFIFCMVIGAMEPDQKSAVNAPAAATRAASEQAAPVATIAPEQTLAPPHLSGADIMAAAPANSRAEERAGIRAFCEVYRDLPDSNSGGDMADTVAAMLKADQMVSSSLSEPVDRANIVVTRIAKSFGDGIYGPGDCREALAGND